MSKPYFACLLLVVGTSGCNPSAQTSNADASLAQVGRFQFYPASGEMPAVLLDTVTGCVETFRKATSVENPRDVDWWRQYEDVGVPKLTYEKGQPKQIPNSTPPQRCPTAKANQK